MQVTRFSLFILIFCAVTVSAKAQQRDITGDWYGVFMKARAVLAIKDNGGDLHGVFKSPDQTAQEFRMDTVSIKGDTLSFVVKSLSLRYYGVWKEDSSEFEGYFLQGGQQLPLNFSRKKLDKEDMVAKRPQEPKPPFDYEIEEVQFRNTKDSVTLAGTFTKPRGAGKFPAVLLITGSGPQNRNEEIFDHKLFWVLADQFTRNGIAVLRYDDRGVAKSTGNFAKSDVYDFARDAAAGYEWLLQRADVDKAKVGLLGHSEGGMVIQIVAAENKSVAFLVSMAGVGLDGVTLGAQQNYAVNLSSGMPDSLVKKISVENTRYLQLLASEKNVDSLRRKAVPMINRMYDMLPAQYRRGLERPAYTFQVITGSTTPSMLSLLRFKPELYLPKIKCPVLAINGGRDIQVSAKENLESINNLLKTAGNKDVTVREFPGLNHLFQECKSCTVAEYASLEQTISPEVLEVMTKWIQQHTGLQK